MAFRLEKNDWYIAIFIAVLGFIFSTREFIVFLNAQTPFIGLLAYYGILFGVFFALSRFGLAINSIRIDTTAKTIGLLLVTFAFFIVVDWESCYVNEITNGSCENVSNIYFASEDGATYYLWSQFASDIPTARILTYVITPFILTLIGASLIRGRLPFS